MEFYKNGAPKGRYVAPGAGGAGGGPGRGYFRALGLAGTLFFISFV